MNEIEVQQIFKEMGERIKHIYQHIDQARQELQNFNEATSRAEAYLKDFTAVSETMQAMAEVLGRFEQQRLESLQTLQQLQRTCVAAHTQSMEYLNPIEDASILMRREVTHSTDTLEEGQSPVPETIGKSVIILLRLGIRLAKTVYPAEQIEKLKQDGNTAQFVAFRAGWEAWLKELNAYLQDVISMIQQYPDVEQTDHIAAISDETTRLQSQMQDFTGKRQEPVHAQDNALRVNESDNRKKPSARRSAEKVSKQTDDEDNSPKDDVT